MDEQSRLAPDSTMSLGHDYFGASQSQVLLNRLDDELIGIDEIVATASQSPPIAEMIMRSAHDLANEHHFGYEVRSLRHAVTLLGLERLRALLKDVLAEQTPLDHEPEKRKSA